VRAPASERPPSCNYETQVRSPEAYRERALRYGGHGEVTEKLDVVSEGHESFGEDN